MFGYIVPLKSELKVRELALYQAYYCGLCRTIGKRYPQLARLSLSYDCSFLALLADGLYGEGKYIKRRCALKPLKAKRAVMEETPGIVYAADVNVLLAVNHLRDDWKDEKKAMAFIGAKALSGAYAKAKKRHPALAAEIEADMARLTAIEAKKCVELDPPADASARILKSVATHMPGLTDAQTLVMEELFYNLGRWVYLADAWDDREKDQKRNSYNPFLLAKTSLEQASFLLNISVNQAIKAYELLDLCANKGVLDNILYEGCPEKTRMLLGGVHE